LLPVKVIHYLSIYGTFLGDKMIIDITSYCHLFISTRWKLTFENKKRCYELIFEFFFHYSYWVVFWYNNNFCVITAAFKNNYSLRCLKLNTLWTTRKMVFKRLKAKMCSNGRNHMKRNLMAIEGLESETERTKNIQLDHSPGSSYVVLSLLGQLKKSFLI
jgi:hypothetical protein